MQLYISIYQYIYIYIYISLGGLWSFKKIIEGLVYMAHMFLRQAPGESHGVHVTTTTSVQRNFC